VFVANKFNVVRIYTLVSSSPKNGIGGGDDDNDDN
jgi:hypothetical protein